MHPASRLLRAGAANRAADIRMVLGWRRSPFGNFARINCVKPKRGKSFAREMRRKAASAKQ